MQKLNEEIKTGQLKQVYLLYGEEAYLRSQYRDKLKTALLGDGDPMNCHYFEGKDISVGEVIDLADHAFFCTQKGDYSGEQRLLCSWRRTACRISGGSGRDGVFRVCGAGG